MTTKQDPGTPDVPDDVPTPITPPSPIVPEPETRQLLRGVIVTVTNIPDDFGLIFQEGNPDIYIPNLGYVNFLIATGNVLSWSVDLAVKNRRCFIPCPWEGGALRVEGTLGQALPGSCRLSMH